MGSGLGKLTTEEEERTVSLRGTPAKSFHALFDPRSPSEEINRTPIRVLDNDITAMKAHVAALDPRSPSEEINRTPIRVLDDDIITSKAHFAARDPRSPSLGVERTPIQLEDHSIDLRPNLDESLVLKEPSGITLSPPTPPVAQQSHETLDISPIPSLNLSTTDSLSLSPSPNSKYNESEHADDVPAIPVAVAMEPNDVIVAESFIQTPVLSISTLNPNVKRSNTENAKRNLRTIVLDKENATLASKNAKNTTPSQKRTPLGHVSANSPALVRPRTIR